MTYRVLDLFSGIGGFSLGLERAGFKTVAFCEIEPFCRRVLAKHWPGVPIYHDIRELTAERLRADDIVPDVLCGGFPCQDISDAGKGAGIDGERSGLWSEYARLIGEIRPDYVIVENVAALLGRGLGRVLGDLAALGFDAEWHCIPASAVGAPHRRDRIWIVAYTGSGDVRSVTGCVAGVTRAAPAAGREQADGFDHGCPVVANTNSRGRREQGHVPEATHDAEAGQSGDCRSLSDAGGSGLPPSEREAILGARRWLEGRAASERDWWSAEPDVGRVVDGPASRLDRRKRLIGLGNAVVPQIPELIGRAILAAESATQPSAKDCAAA